MSIRIAIIEFPGTNCERETYRAVLKAGMEPIRFRWNGDRNLLASCDGFVLGGGFSYEDRSRSGIIAALDPIMEILRQQDDAGKPILGICNGAQILLESGIVPGLEGHRIGGALASNKQIVDAQVVGTGFYNAWVHVKALRSDPPHAFFKHLGQDQVLRIPAAHAEGRFVIPPLLLAQMHLRGVPMLRYCDAEGTETPSFPVNPNGSVENFAGIGNLRGNALAIMPHPERTDEGLCLFTAMREYLETPKKARDPFDFTEPEFTECSHELHPGSRELVVSTIITDNTAVSVEQALRARGLPIRVRRAVHWELQRDGRGEEPTFDKEVRQAIDSGELLNPNKEFLLDELPASTRMFLVRCPEQDDSTGLHTLQVLRRRFGISTISSIRHGILWMLSVDDPSAEHIIKKATDTNIFNNPYSHRRYRYERAN